MQNPIGEADLEWILHRNCEGAEQLRKFLIRHIPVDIPEKMCINNDVTEKLNLRGKESGS